MKPVKNNRRIDPRYFLDETTYRAKQYINETSHDEYTHTSDQSDLSGAGEDTGHYYKSPEDEANFAKFKQGMIGWGVDPESLLVSNVEARTDTADETSTDKSTVVNQYVVPAQQHPDLAKNLMKLGFKPEPDGTIRSPQQMFKTSASQGPEPVTESDDRVAGSAIFKNMVKKATPEWSSAAAGHFVELVTDPELGWPQMDTFLSEWGEHIGESLEQRAEWLAPRFVKIAKEDVWGESEAEDTGEPYEHPAWRTEAMGERLTNHLHRAMEWVTGKYPEKSRQGEKEEKDSKKGSREVDTEMGNWKLQIHNAWGNRSEGREERIRAVFEKTKIIPKEVQEKILAAVAADDVKAMKAAVPLEEGKKRKVVKQKKNFDQLLQEELDRVDNVLYESQPSQPPDAKLASRLTVKHVQTLTSDPPMYVFAANFELMPDPAGLKNVSLKWSTEGKNHIRGGGEGSGYGDRENEKTEQIGATTGKRLRRSIVFYSPHRRGSLTVAVNATPVWTPDPRTKGPGTYVHYIRYPGSSDEKTNRSGGFYEETSMGDAIARACKDQPPGTRMVGNMNRGEPSHFTCPDPDRQTRRTDPGQPADTRPTSGDYRTRPYLKCLPNGKCVRMVGRR